MADNKKRSEIKQEIEKKKKQGDDASQEALKLAEYAEKVKETFESFEGEATAETASLIEGSVTAVQSSIEKKYNEAVEKAEDINEELDEDNKNFEQGIKADESDINKIKKLSAEAKQVGVGSGSIDIAEKSKQKEIDFLQEQTSEVEAAQEEIETKLNDSKQRRTAARFQYKSKNTLGN
jgi:chromosome segregation ATPase